MRKSTQKTINKTKIAIQTYGWRRGHMGSPKIGFCLYGALKYATKNHPFKRLAAAKELRRRIFVSDKMTFREKINAVFNYGDNKLYKWNDQVNRDRVLEVLYNEPDPES